MNEKVGVFLSRMQPLHIGHLGIIEKALEENDKVIVIIGSKNKKGTIRNPLDVTLRREILEEALEDKFGINYKDRIIVKELPDWSMETDIASNIEWGRYLYYNIVSVSEQKKFSIYFSDDRSIIENWFDEELRNRINLRLFERQAMFQAVSSTKIRNAFLNNDKEYINLSCPNAVLKRYEKIKGIIEEVYSNPVDDFKMEE